MVDVLSTNFRFIKARVDHFLDQNGRPCERMDYWTIEATANVESFLIRAPRGTELVVALDGVTVGEPTKVEDGVLTYEVTLPVPLAAGQRREIDLYTRFNYTETVPPDFKWVVGPHDMQRFELTVVFEPRRTPKSAWQMRWNEAGEVLYRKSAEIEPVPDPLDDRLRIHCVLHELVQGVYGFSWMF